jgi:hypothetical protein
MVCEIHGAKQIKNNFLKIRVCKINGGANYSSNYGIMLRYHLTPCLKGYLATFRLHDNHMHKSGRYETVTSQSVLSMSSQKAGMSRDFEMLSSFVRA